MIFNDFRVRRSKVKVTVNLFWAYYALTLRALVPYFIVVQLFGLGPAVLPLSHLSCSSYRGGCRLQRSCWLTSILMVENVVLILMNILIHLNDYVYYKDTTCTCLIFLICLTFWLLLKKYEFNWNTYEQI